VSHACLYCRRSHMTCDDSRPCQRCIKRDIGHLCHDEPKKPIEPTIPESVPTGLGTNATATAPTQSPFNFPLTGTNGASTWPLLFPPESGGTEFSVLRQVPATLLPLPTFFFLLNAHLHINTVFHSDFLESLEDQSFFNAFAPPASSTPTSELPLSSLTQSQLNATTNDSPIQVLPPSSTTKTERFLLTAADQEDGTRDERLARVIHAKYEAGLLRPFNYVNGYARLGRWMERNVSPQSKQQILQPLTIVRPKFRAIAQSLTDIDLVFIEEAFERLLLSYDRVFSAMGIPACLWRRTGEIYKGNKEFADLVGVDVGLLKDGRLCIYELMSEESAVNYWEKYGHVAFDAAQKAVLTSCVLRPPQERMINCCFSFTIQRDLHGIPTLIAGEFSIPVVRIATCGYTHYPSSQAILSDIDTWIKKCQKLASTRSVSQC
ncbi:hypothetical protein DL93DRAFT_2062069, partial [Clavulina sp. PMI_390]